MLNKLERFLRQYQMVRPGDTVVCAVSGGADSVALLFAMYLLATKLQITVRAAHFNHGLRGMESDRDEQFVRSFCGRYDIPLDVGSGCVNPGKKGLEAAARDARYAFLGSLSGKVATAHTADDNAETVLMHLLRGTGLRGLGGIPPVSGSLIRPMLGITRVEVLNFLEEYCLEYVEDSSNATDQFLRNRLRHNVIPLLKRENPRFSENISGMALRLRDDEQALEAMLPDGEDLCVSVLREMLPALRRRRIAGFLEICGVNEPESQHIEQVEGLIFSDKPSAKAHLPGGITVCRDYDRVILQQDRDVLEATVLECPGTVTVPMLGIRIVCSPARKPENRRDCFTVCPEGKIFVRHRLPGDKISIKNGHKSIKKIFIDEKVPASIRDSIPVLADEIGVLGLFGFGADCHRLALSLPAVEIRFEKMD